jgi:AcrR family transcriptional regulator
MATDWLIGEDRRAAAAERIYDAAADLIARHGFDRLDIDSLAKRAHCSRATLYRHVGGKAQIREQILVRSAGRINQAVLAAASGLPKRERVIEAITVAIREIRADRAVAQLMTPLRQADLALLIESGALIRFAADNTGLDRADAAAAQWVTRMIFSLLVWPGADAEVEADMLRRFVAPAFTD